MAPKLLLHFFFDSPCIFLYFFMFFNYEYPINEYKSTERKNP